MTTGPSYGPLMDIAISWGPMVLLIAVWIFFLSRMGFRRGRYNWYDAQEKQAAELQRQTALLERIAAALEKLRPPNSN